MYVKWMYSGCTVLYQVEAPAIPVHFVNWGFSLATSGNRTWILQMTVERPTLSIALVTLPLRAGGGGGNEEK